MKHFIFIILICVNIVLSSVYANTADKNLTELLQNINSMQADFSQTILNKSGKLLQQSNGEMALQRPGQFRWEVMTPNAQLIVANGKKLWIYDKDLEQITIRSLTKAAGEIPGLLLSDASPSLEKDFYVKEMNNVPNHLQRFVLTTKNENSLFAAIQMEFINQKINQMQLKDHSGQTTIIKFKNIQTNVALSNSLFHFIPPKNIDVIDETRR